MSVMSSQITDNLTICSTTCLVQGDFTGKIKAPHSSYWPFAYVRGIFHRSSMDSPHKGPVMRKAFPHYDVAMNTTCYYLPFTPNQIVDLDECHTHVHVYIVYHFSSDITAAITRPRIFVYNKNIIEFCASLFNSKAAWWQFLWYAARVLFAGSAICVFIRAYFHTSWFFWRTV